MRLFRPFALLVAVFAAGAALAADVVSTRDGRRLEGTVLSALGGTVSMQSGSGQLRFAASDVERIDWDRDRLDVGSAIAELLVTTWSSRRPGLDSVPAVSMLRDLQREQPATQAAIARRLAEEAELLFGDEERENPCQACELLEALVLAGWWRSEGLLLDVIAGPGTRQLRRRAYELLESAASERGLPRLAARLASEDPVDEAAVRLLRTVAGAIDHRAVWQALQPFLTHRTAGVRARAWEACVGEPPAPLERLPALACRDGAEEVRFAVAAWLAAEQRVGLLAQLVEDDSPRVVARAIQLGRGLGDAAFELAPLLIEVAAERGGHLREQAVRALAEVTGQDYGGRLDRWREWWRLEGEGQLFRRQEFAERLGTWSLRSPSERVALLRAAADLPQCLPAEDLVSTLQDGTENPHVRMAAARLLVAWWQTAPGASGLGRPNPNHERKFLYDLLVTEWRRSPAEALVESEDEELPPFPAWDAGFRELLVRLSGVDLGDSSELWLRWGEQLVPQRSQLERREHLRRIWVELGDRPRVAVAIVQRIGAEKDIYSLDLVHEIVEESVDPVIHRAAVLCLGELSRRREGTLIGEALDELLAILERAEPEESVRATGLATLWRVAGPDGVGLDADALLEWAEDAAKDAQRR